MTTLKDRAWRRQMTRRDFLWLSGMTVAGVALGGPLAGCATDPVSGRRRLMLMSEEQEIALDRQHAPHQFSNDYGLVQDRTLNAYLAEVGGGIAKVSHRPHMPYGFHAVNANYVNAYTFPGGTMACTRGILVDLNEEAELAALLGHETGHVTARHSARRQTQAMLATVALGGLGLAATQSEQLAGYSNAVFAIGALGAGALLASYSRDNEREADALGLEYMARAGHDPQGMIGLMGLLQGLSSRDPNALELMFSTHPMSSERFATAQREARRLQADSPERGRGRERYMDNTAALRRIRPAIHQLRAGEADMAAKRYPAAEQKFAAALKDVPDDYCGLLLMAQCQTAQGRHREAERYLAKAKAANPGEAKALHLSGVNQLAQDRPEAALADFNAYERALPGNPNTQFLLGVTHESMQNRSAAAEHYRRYLQAGADTPQARHAAERLQAWR